MKISHIKKFVLSAFFLLAFAGSSYALPGGFLNVYTTDGINTTPKSVFSNEQPYVYMEIDIPADASGAVTSTGWNAPDGSSFFGNIFQTGTATQRWDTVNWNSVKQSGTWTVYTNYFDSKGNNQVESTEFTVTPEPATLALMAAGGIPLFYSRRKKLEGGVK